MLASDPPVPEVTHSTHLEILRALFRGKGDQPEHQQKAALLDNTHKESLSKLFSIKTEERTPKLTQKGSCIFPFLLPNPVSNYSLSTGVINEIWSLKKENHSLYNRDLSWNISH